MGKNHFTYVQSYLQVSYIAVGNMGERFLKIVVKWEQNPNWEQFFLVPATAFLLSILCSLCFDNSYFLLMEFLMFFTLSIFILLSSMILFLVHFELQILS
jgi:hypothetical protein